MKTLSILFFSVIAFNVSAAQAESLRCNNDLVTEGATTADLLKKCGSPMSVEDLTRIEHNNNGLASSVKFGERWVYNLDKSGFMRLITIENQHITKVELGPRGY